MARCSSRGAARSVGPLLAGRWRAAGLARVARGARVCPRAWSPPLPPRPAGAGVPGTPIAGEDRGFLDDLPLLRCVDHPAAAGVEADVGDRLGRGGGVGEED